MLSFTANICAQTQSITVDTTITADCEFYPFSSSDPIYGLNLSGSVTLNSDTSLIRVVLYDTLFNEYLVYESYPLISSQSSFSFYNECDETCFLDGVNPYSLELQVINATLNLSLVTYDPYLISNADSLRYESKRVTDSWKIQKINDNIDDMNLAWIAGDNEIVEKYYYEKKSMFGNKYNFRGFDYYKGGIYDISFGKESIRSYLSIIDDFDWRNRHDANIDPQPEDNNPYHDGSKGWLTDPKSQKCNHCWVFAPLHATEAIVNLYYNQQINIDLSEQELASCVDPSDNCDGGWAIGSLNYLKNNGVVKETCFGYDPYADYNPYILPSAVNVPCNSELNCGDPFAIKISDRETIDNNELLLKKAIIEKGPIICLINSWWHYIVVAGFGKLSPGDLVYDGPSAEDTIRIVEGGTGDNLIGQTYWIVKNSSASWGQNGFGKIYLPITLQNDVYKIAEFTERRNINTPLIANEFSDEDISCLDFDNDGYLNWGIYETPPADCDATYETRDSDDSNPRLGPFDEDYYSIPIAPLMEVKKVIDENHKDNVPNNSFYSFYDESVDEDGDQITLTFTIENNGNAQLNLYGNILDDENIYISGENEADFQLDSDFPYYEIPMGTSQAFQIQFTLTEPIDEPKIATITIDVEEPDMDDYVFTLVFAKCPEPLAETIYIRESEVYWNDIHPFFGDVQVEDGATLYVRGQAAFVSGASLIIETGAKVYVDGGVLTSLSLCGSLWQGVDVWGDRYLSQYIIENQGYIKLFDGGKISYAEVGIETIKKKDEKVIKETEGGIVVMNNGIIENCKIGVRFYPYTNFWPVPEEPVPNISSFILSTFINDKYRAPDKQLFFEEVDGIDIKGCTFENTAPSNPLNPHIGIYSDMSAFTVSYKNLTPVYPPVDILKSSFKNFDYGIYAVNTPAIGRPYISQSVFEDNKRGIYMSMVDYPVIIQNEFNVRKRFSFYPEIETMIGLYINDQSRGFVVEENIFYSELRKTELQDLVCEGITLNNTGQTPNEIYNNSFSDLTVGVIAAGENRDEEGAGLCVKCNDYRDCLKDIWVVPEKDENGNPITGPTIGIAMKQGDTDGSGDPTLAAGNSFSKDNDDLGVLNYDNEVSWNDIYYTHHNNQDPPAKIVPFPFSTDIELNPDEFAFYSKELSCPSNYNGGGIDITAKTGTFTSELININAYVDTLNTLVDGGDTEDLAFVVNISTPPEAADVRQELLNESPYLSDTVMKSAIAKEDVLPNAMVRDVMVANPQSAKSAEVLQILDARDEPMPGYMMDQIMQGQNSCGAKELLEQKLAGHKTKKGKAMAQLIHYYLADTTDYAGSNDSILNLIEDDNELSSYYQLTMKYLGLRDSANAYNTFYNISYEFDLNSEQEDEFDLYEDLIDMQWQMITDTILPDSLMIDALFDIEQYYNTTPGICARNMLIGLGELEYDEPVYFPDFNKSSTIELMTWPEETRQENIMKLFPNPAGDYFIMEYDLSDHFGDFTMQVVNIDGVVLKKLALPNKQNQVVITTQDYSSGIYIVQVLVSGLMVEADKITIVK